MAAINSRTASSEVSLRFLTIQLLLASSVSIGGVPRIAKLLALDQFLEKTLRFHETQELPTQIRTAPKTSGATGRFERSQHARLSIRQELIAGRRGYLYDCPWLRTKALALLFGRQRNIRIAESSQQPVVVTECCLLTNPDQIRFVENG